MFMAFTLSKMSHFLSLFTWNVKKFDIWEQGPKVAITKSYGEMRKEMTATWSVMNIVLDIESGDGCNLWTYLKSLIYIVQIDGFYGV